MMMSLGLLLGYVGLLSLLPPTFVHSTIGGVIVDGVYYQGYNPNMQYQKPIPTLGAWSTPQNQSNGFISGSGISSLDIICHVGATSGNASIPVKAGAQVSLQWTQWPDSHHGPMLTYIAQCSGPCESVDKTSLSFSKIDATGVFDGSTTPGQWGSDVMIKNNNTWTVAIPTSIAKGNYVLRHGTIALQSAGSEGQAQAYPFCFNMVVDSEGTDTPQGVKGQELYKTTDPGLVVDIYHSPVNYTVPGPALYGGAVSIS